jgi:hypothetical protein
VDERLINEGHLLYKFPDFNHWFFEEDDHSAIKECLDQIINSVVEKKEFYIENQPELENFLESHLNKLMLEVFSEDIREMYKFRLQNIAFLLNIEELKHFRNIAASLAWAIDPENNMDISDNSFFREIIRKTITEGLIRYQYNLYNEEKQSSHPWNLRKSGQDETVNHQKYEEQGIEEIVEILCGD